MSEREGLGHEWSGKGKEGEGKKRKDTDPSISASSKLNMAVKQSPAKKFLVTYSEVWKHWMLFDPAGVVGAVVFVVAYKDNGARGEAVEMRAWWKSMRVAVMTRRGSVPGAILSCDVFDAPMSGFGMTDYHV